MCSGTKDNYIICKTIIFVLPSYFNLNFALEWELVSEKKECSGSEIGENGYNDVDDCASYCKGKSTMFAFGTNDFGTTRCYGDGCRCLCETSATKDGTCTTLDHDGYRLYKYKYPKLGDYYVSVINISPTH